METRLPVLQGQIRRRILVNFRVDAEALQRRLPHGFRPKLLGDDGVAGICLIRLESMRPRFAPRRIGVASENAAHRAAVFWTDPEGHESEGVYIWRRDTGSIWNHLAGGRVFPGRHRLAGFEVQDDGDFIDLRMRSADGHVDLGLIARSATSLPVTSRFRSCARPAISSRAVRWDFRRVATSAASIEFHFPSRGGDFSH
jgi:hypothetical protein